MILLASITTRAEQHLSGLNRRAVSVDFYESLFHQAEFYPPVAGPS